MKLEFFVWQSKLTAAVRIWKFKKTVGYNFLRLKVIPLKTKFNIECLSFFLSLPFTDSTPVYRSSNLVGTLRLIDSIGLRVERPYSPSSQRIPWYFSRSLAHTHADIDPIMLNMCTGAFYVLQRLNNSYAIYTVVSIDWSHFV